MVVFYNRRDARMSLQFSKLPARIGDVRSARTDHHCQDRDHLGDYAALSTRSELTPLALPSFCHVTTSRRFFSYNHSTKLT
jgi:hypothetical protein